MRLDGHPSSSRHESMICSIAVNGVFGAGWKISAAILRSKRRHRRVDSRRIARKTHQLGVVRSQFGRLSTLHSCSFTSFGPRTGTGAASHPRAGAPSKRRRSCDLRQARQRYTPLPSASAARRHGLTQTALRPGSSPRRPPTRRPATTPTRGRTVSPSRSRIPPPLLLTLLLRPGLGIPGRTLRVLAATRRVALYAERRLRPLTTATLQDGLAGSAYAFVP